MKKKNFILKCVGILFILFSFLYNHYILLRLVFLLLGIGLFFFFSHFSNKKKILYSLVCIVCSFFMDSLLVKYLNRIPIYSYEIKSSEEFSTYNSFFYRMYDCNGQLIYDALYKKNYMCTLDLPEKNVNSLLAQIVNNFSEFHNKFIHVEGKISGISGSESISMQTFETSENSINGQVNFSDTITLKIINNGKLEKTENLKIYDTVHIIGRIDKIRKNGQNKEIVMEDAKIISQNNFHNYDIKAIESKTCDSELKLLSKANDYTYYSNCLNSIYVTYDEENRYELGYVLTDQRMTFDMLIKDLEKEENEVGELYKQDTFHLIKCKNSNTVIIGNKKLNLDTKYCENFNIEPNESSETSNLESE